MAARRVNPSFAAWSIRAGTSLLSLVSGHVGRDDRRHLSGSAYPDSEEYLRRLLTVGRGGFSADSNSWAAKPSLRRGSHAPWRSRYLSSRSTISRFCSYFAALSAASSEHNRALPLPVRRPGNDGNSENRRDKIDDISKRLDVISRA
jgi:hypothetical protein